MSVLHRFDDSSSMSSLTSATTTTSSSMGSSTCGDLAEMFSQPSAPPIKETPKKEAKTSSKSGNKSSPKSSSHVVVKCSPRKAQIKKTDSSNQTESTSAVALVQQQQQNQQPSPQPNHPMTAPNSLHQWKKYLHDHALKGNGQDQRRPSTSPNHSGGQKVAVVSSIQSGTDESTAHRAHSEQSPRKSSNKTSHSPSHNYSGRAVAVIRASPNTSPQAQAKSSHHGHHQSDHRKGHHTVKHPPPVRQYQSDTIYSDSEAVTGGRSYPFCLTNQAQVMQQSQTGAVAIDGPPRDPRLSSIYGQVATPWMQRQAQLAAAGSGGYSGRNAMTEAESMESVASLSQMTGQRWMSPAPIKALPLMSARKPRIHATAQSVTNVCRTGSGTGLRKCKENEAGDIFSSSLSLLSNVSGLTNNEERNSHSVEMRIRKLRRELEQSNEKVATLTSQLNTNAHMVAAFEQSLMAMTARLQQQTALSEHKDNELKMLKMLIEELNECRRRGDEAAAGRGHRSRDKKDKTKKSSSSIIRRHTFASSSEELKIRSAAKATHDRSHEAPDDQLASGAISDHKSSGNKKRSESVTPEASLKSGGWFRSSLNRFRKTGATSAAAGGKSPAVSSPVKVRSGSCSQLDHDEPDGSNSLPASPLHSNGASGTPGPVDQAQAAELVIDKLRAQLSEKDRQLTDLRLEQLASAAQLDSLNETLTELKRELNSVKQENSQLRVALADTKIQNNCNLETRSNSANSVSVNNSVSNVSTSPDNER